MSELIFVGVPLILLFHAAGKFFAKKGRESRTRRHFFPDLISCRRPDSCIAITDSGRIEVSSLVHRCDGGWEWYEDSQ